MTSPFNKTIINSNHIWQLKIIIHPSVGTLTLRAHVMVNPFEWFASDFSLKYHPWVKHWGHEKKGNDC